MKPEGHKKIRNFEERIIFLKGIKAFIILWVVFSAGLFFGEWLLDVVMKSERDTIREEALDAVLVGLIVSFLLVVQNESLKKIRLRRFFQKEQKNRTLS